MSRITGLELDQEIPEKVLLLYQAVEALIAEGADVPNVRVSTITDRAGIGKGTAYDYFDTKEEIIACALVYSIRKNTNEICEVLLQQENFEKQIQFLMDEMDKQGNKQLCFVRFVHVMTDNSGISLQVKKILTEDPLERYLPERLFRPVINRARERGEVRLDLPVNYMIASVFSRMLTYMMCIFTQDCFKVDPAELRPFIYQGIMDELV